jgi:LPPG:FO 2-phospho-L-lactate transferase
MTANSHSLTDSVVLLVGGVGGAKLAVGMAKVLPPEALTIIVNTGDDFEHLGLHVSPDLDTVMYSLAGLAHPVNGWGVIDDTRQAMDMIQRLGGPDWFGLGDRDLGTNLMRTSLLREGKTLTEVTAQLARQLGVRHPVLPMSDDAVRTTVETDQGRFAFQEYFVRERWQPVVQRIEFAGAAEAQASDAVKSALENASLIVFGPSNPYLSIDPILTVPGVRELIAESSAPCVAVSPIIGGKAIKGPAAKIMAELGADVSPVGIATYFQDLLDGFVLDEVDQEACDRIASLGMRPTAQKTFMDSLTSKVQLAKAILNWTEETFT